MELILFGTNSNLRWNFPAGTSKLNPFGASSDCPWDLQFPEIPYWGFLLVSPRWGLLFLFIRGELHFPRWGFTILLLSGGTTCGLPPGCRPPPEQFLGTSTGLTCKVPVTQRSDRPETEPALFAETHLRPCQTTTPKGLPSYSSSCFPQLTSPRESAVWSHMTRGENLE